MKISDFLSPADTMVDVRASDKRELLRELSRKAAHNLGLEVIAEGVETAAQAAFLSNEKCEEAQGFLYSRPLPILEFEKFVSASQRKGAQTEQHASARAG